MDFKMETDMDCLAKLNEEQRVAFMKAFVRLANSDGKLDEDEIDFIKNIAITYGIPKERTQDVLSANSDEDVVKAVKIIDNRRAALELIKEMCILAHADDNLSDKETLFIGQVGMAMGVDLDKIEQISNWVIDRIIWLEEAKIIFEEV